MDFLDIYKNGRKPLNESIIKPVSVDEITHKIGILNLLDSMVPGYVIDENNKAILNLLFNYFTGNISWCNDNSIDLNKGIFICGNVGTGKSAIMKAFREYTCHALKVNSFKYYHAIDIVDMVNVQGVQSLCYFGHNLYGIKAQPITCYIDDIASKNEKVKNYGTEISVIEQLISIRYNVFCRYKKLTHFSTNIAPSMLKELYDERIIDRLSEMCNVITLLGKSKR